MRAAAHIAHQHQLAHRATVPTALVRDLLSVGLMLEYRATARARLAQALGPDTAATVLRRTLASSHG
jgi:hypothetical protein